MKRLTTDEFIIKANIIHNNKFDYSISDYIGGSKKIKIICPIHGIFEQKAFNHLRGDGCSKCSGNKKLSNDVFIINAKEIHGDKYDYSLVYYKGIDKKVKIICPIHGVFEQSPSKHIGKTKRGCPKCNGGVKINNDEFVKRSKEIHGDKYDYSLVYYINTTTKVKIICKHHGIFEQKPKHHIYGCGCQKCLESNGEKEIIKYLNNNKIDYIKQKSFDNCRNIKELPFDFYLPFYNCCIEFDGEQHYKPINYFGGEKSFILRQKRDNIKTNYCKSNNINLLRISYKENVENKLNEYGFRL